MAVEVKQDSAKIRVVPQSSQNLIMDIQESRDGSRLLTHDRKLAPRLWDAHSLKLLLVLRSHEEPVTWLSFSPDGRRIVTLSSRRVCVWDSLRAKQLESVVAPSTFRFTTAAFSPDSSKLAIGTDYGGVVVHELESGTADLLLKGTAGRVEQVKVLSDNVRIASGSSDGMVNLWSLTSPQKAVTVQDPHGPVRWIEVSEDGRYLAATTLTGHASVLDTLKGKWLYDKPHAVTVRSVGNVQGGAVFVGEPQRLLTANAQGALILFDPESGDERARFEGHDGAIREIRTSADHLRFATAGDDSAVYIWDAKDGSKLPFKMGDSTPTAGEFSPDGKVFWVGYEDGAVRAHDLTTGDFRTEALGSVLDLDGCIPIAGGKTLAMRWPRGWWIHKSFAQNESKFLPTTDNHSPIFAPNGKSALYVSSDDTEYPWRIVNLETDKTLMRYRNIGSASFAPDSNCFVTAHTDSSVNVWSADTGELIKGWQLDKAKPINMVLFRPGTSDLLSHVVGDSEILIWDFMTADIKKRLPIAQAGVGWFAVSPSGEYLAVYNKKGLTVWNLNTGDSKTALVSGPESVFATPIAFSPDSQRIIVRDDDRCRVWSSVDAKLLLDVEDDESFSDDDVNFAFSPDSQRVLATNGAKVRVYSTSDGSLLREVTCVEDVTGAFFIEKGSRLLTTDRAEAVTIWDIATEQPKRIGNLVAIRNYGWVVYDADGRFDAVDPSEVVGTNFVKEWDGGLEAIAMDQLKSSFYEPGLLGKLLGFDPEPVREVPDLEGLRLYPSVEVAQAPDNPMLLKIKLQERDEGGIGKVAVFVNGKLVTKKTGTGFFELDLTEQSSFLLPETIAKQGNLVQVTASNREGTLTSPPTTVNIGFPPGLKAPLVHMHVLVVGVGDYAGQAGDLASPPKDATTLGSAISQAGSALLPGCVHVTSMTTEPGSELKPTRSNIFKWFDRVAKEATSSDIVLVFLSGHGTNQIGEHKGYFFLTEEADPGDLSPASVGTVTISADDLRDRLSQIPASKQVVILDTCHSGAASTTLFAAARSVSGDYQRAWESIKDATGTWMLAGSAADQLSYESSNVEHGVLTYSLLEAIDKATADGLRPGTDGTYFLDVERWLKYAAERVESLKSEIGLGGIQRPEFKRSTSGTTFDIGVIKSEDRGRWALKSPKPIVIVGEFEHEKEDPAGLEDLVRIAMKESQAVKAWYDVPRHPAVYRIAGDYSWNESQDVLTVKIYVQRFDADQKRRNLEVFELTGKRSNLTQLSQDIKTEVELRVLSFERRRQMTEPGSGSMQPPPLVQFQCP